MKKTYFIISAMLIYIMFSILPVYAENINITGEVKDNLKLSIDNDCIFDRKNIVPGDEWSTDITLQNHSKDSIKVSLLNIEVDNKAVGECLSLYVLSDDSVLYEGAYITDKLPYFSVLLNAMEHKHISVVVKVLPSANNSLQNENLHSVWEFEGQTAAEPKPTSIPAVKAKTAIVDNRNNSGSHSTGIIARIFSKDKSTDVKTKSVESAESDASEAFMDGRNLGAEISEENIDDENTSNDAGSELVLSGIDTEKFENKGQNSKTKSVGSDKKNKPVKTGNEHIPNNTTEITNIMMISLPFIVIAFILIRRRKSKRR